jgi:hypothetical protein
MPAPKVYIKNATRIRNKTMPHPQQKNKDAKQVAERRNPINSVIILQSSVSLKKSRKGKVKGKEKKLRLYLSTSGS